MKKKTCLLLTLLFISFPTFAQYKKEYKELLINGEKVYKWVDVKETNYYYSIGKDGTVLRTTQSNSLLGNIAKFDSKGNLVYEKDSLGLENWYEYDSNNNRIYRIQGRREENKTQLEYLSTNSVKPDIKEGKFTEYWYEYDKKGNLIYEKDSKGFEAWNDYDSKGNRIHRKDSNKNIFDYKYEITENGKIEYVIINGKTSSVFTYDSEGNKIQSLSDDLASWHEYNSKGDIIHYIYDSKSDGSRFEVWREYEYDEEGRIVKEIQSISD